MILYRVEFRYFNNELNISELPYVVKKYSKRKGLFILTNGVRVKEELIDKIAFNHVWTLQKSKVYEYKKMLLEKRLEYEKGALERWSKSYTETIARLTELLDDLIERFG